MIGLRHNWEQQDVKTFEGHSYIYNAQQFGHDSKEKVGREGGGRAGGRDRKKEKEKDRESDKQK